MELWCVEPFESVGFHTLELCDVDVNVNVELWNSYGVGVDGLKFIDRAVSGFKPIIGPGRRCKGLHLGAARHNTSSSTAFSLESRSFSGNS